MKNPNSTTRPTSPCCLPLGMFTPVIILVSTIRAIIPHSNYFCKRRFRWSETGRTAGENDNISRLSER